MAKREPKHYFSAPRKKDLSFLPRWSKIPLSAGTRSRKKRTPEHGRHEMRNASNIAAALALAALLTLGILALCMADMLSRLPR